MASGNINIKIKTEFVGPATRKAINEMNSNFIRQIFEQAGGRARGGPVYPPPRTLGDIHLDRNFIFDSFITQDERDGMKNTRNEFWMIHRNGGAAKCRHATKAVAVREAERLARENPGVDFYILKTTAVRRAETPKIVEPKIIPDPWYAGQ